MSTQNIKCPYKWSIEVSSILPHLKVFWGESEFWGVYGLLGPLESKCDVWYSIKQIEFDLTS